MIGRTLSSFFWGLVADRYGRKPVIVFALFSVVILNTLFGLSTKFLMAFITRFLLGVLNGLLAPMKAYCIEVCRAEHHALGLSIVHTAWAMGLVIGPALGGYLAQPATKYPDSFSKLSALGRFPYLLPSLAVSLFAAVVLVVCIWLPETIHLHNCYKRKVTLDKATESNPNCADTTENKRLINNWPWISATISFSIFALHDTAYGEIISLWAVSGRRYGGLSFSSEDIGNVLAVAGASLLVCQLFFYQWVDKTLGTVYSSRFAAALSTVIVATTPFMTYLSGFKLSLAIYPALMIKNILSTTVGTGLSLLQNNAVPQKQRGAANGISTTAMSFFKAVAPIGAGALFSWAQKHADNIFVSGDQVVFLILNLILFLGVLSTFEPFLVIPAKPEHLF
ncbi:unnamed protein product [Urochloa decumbens]|uniref:Major facilitator superfamily (MFS) profile domain-containing protein n=1 Tax=Urochloa decumbens TaxID=240449 RepID=A0ABC8YH54_9POAL